MKYKDYIWDIGGTLFDTLSTSVRAFRQTLNEYHLTASDAEIYAMLKKTSTHEACRHFAPSCVTAFEKRYHAIEAPMQEKPLMFPDTRKTLAFIAEHGGRNFIISHRDLQVVDFLESCQLIQFFSYVITSHDQFKRKPDPESLEYLVTHFHVNKKQALMIGDREIDILAAKNAGVDAALFSPDGFIQSKDATYTTQTLFDVTKF